MKKSIVCFILIIVVFILFSHKARAASESPTAIDGRYYFHEIFSDKNLKDNTVTDQYGNTIWKINTAAEQTNTITDDGALELGGARYMQRAVLGNDSWQNKQNYAMEFTLNIRKEGNEGNSGRPVAIIIPRSKDAEFNEYYAVTYYMENTIANQFKFKWAIINTAAPTKMEPLVEGYYLLQENVDYTARLVIQNTDDGNVNIKFYIDGPTNPAKQYEPLLEYTDTTKYKILSGKTGPALGMVGYSDAGWGTSPVVRYDNVKLFGLDEYEQYAKGLKDYALTNPEDIDTTDSYGEIKYLINKGILSSESGNHFDPDQNVTVGQFIQMLISLKGEKYSPVPPALSALESQKVFFTFSGSQAGPLWPYIRRAKALGLIKSNEFWNYRKPVTRCQAALLIARLNGNPVMDIQYASFIKDSGNIPDNDLNAVLYAYYEGCLCLDDAFEFKGDGTVTRADAAEILLKMLDPGYKKVNYPLQLPSILSSGAVLQGNKNIPVWGRGMSGDTITVTFKDQVKTTIVKNGSWYLELDPVPYGGPYKLTVQSSEEKIELADIQVGEVFVVAGQSNAEMFMSECNDTQSTISKFKNKPNLRFFWGEQITSVTPNFTSIGTWQPSYEWILKSSPAIGTFFAEKLLETNKALRNVTIGIIRMTYGGTSIEAFMPDCIDKENNVAQQDNEPIISGFWNGFMAPITPYAIKGVIYYQGENSTQLGYQYESLLRNYLKGLRTAFKNPALPIMLVQIAGYGYNDYQTDDNEWPIIRAVQQKVADSTDHVGLVTALDYSSPDPLQIHPKDKKEVGTRLANLAMDLIYGKASARSAELKEYKFEGNKALLKFDYDGGAIHFKQGAKKDFEVLDSQGKWHMANALIDGASDVLEISSDEVLEPVGVRYAWVNNPNICLYNKADLPVLPFNFNTVLQTTSNIIKMPKHLLKTNDAIVNESWGNQFRVVMVMDENTLSHQYAIEGQSPGDTIDKLSRQGAYTALKGTTDTVIKIPAHGLSEGDWVRNDTRGWTPRRVSRVVDENTVEVDAINGQSAGDTITIYKLTGKTTAD